MSSHVSAASLVDVQRWLLSVVTAPGGLRDGLKDAQRYGSLWPVRVPDGVRPGERLAIYARGYLDRLLSCLRADYPALRRLLGEEMFDAFALDYLRTHAPRHYSLFELGAGFPLHLAQTRPPADSLPSAQRVWLSLPLELSRLERARLEVMRERGVEGQPRERLRTSALAMLMGAAEEQKVRVAPCLRLLEVSHDVHALWMALERGERPALPEARPTWLAVSRVDYRIVLTELAEWQHRILASCRTPRSALSLVEELAANGDERGRLLGDLLLWLPIAEDLAMLEIAV